MIIKYIFDKVFLLDRTLSNIHLIIVDKYYNSFLKQTCLRLGRDFLKMDKKALAKFINFSLEDICQNHIKVICSYAQQ